MKILLKYFPHKPHQLGDDTVESSVRTAIAPLAELIRLKSLKVLGYGQDQDKDKDSFELVEIETASPAGVIEDQKLADKVEQAIRSQTDVELVEIKLRRTVEFDAIQQLDAKTYRVDPSYALFVAKHGHYREELKTDNIMFARCEYEKFDIGYESTGKISSQSKRGPKAFNPANIYNCFAVALSASDDFRAQILASDSLEVILTMNEQAMQEQPQGSLTISLLTRNQFRFFVAAEAPSATANPEVNQTPATRNSL